MANIEDNCWWCTPLEEGVKTIGIMGMHDSCYLEFINGPDVYDHSLSPITLWLNSQFRHIMGCREFIERMSNDTT